MSVRHHKASPGRVARRTFINSCSTAGALGLLANTVAPTPAHADETSSDEDKSTEAHSDKESTEKVDKVAAKFAEITTFQIGDANHLRQLDFANKAILRWTNPTAGKVFGADYVVLEKGVPRVYVSVYQWFSPYTDASAELSSLTPEPVSAHKDQKTYWATNMPGATFETFPDAPVPASDANQRRAQMRKLANRFEIEFLDTRNQEAGVKRQLRMLTKPVYQYHSQDPQVLDGTIYAFVEGTDPETLLVIQAEKDAKRERETFAYRYALVRRNRDAISAKLDGVKVWDVPYTDVPWKRNDLPYFLGGLNDLKGK